MTRVRWVGIVGAPGALAVALAACSSGTVTTVASDPLAGLPLTERIVEQAEGALPESVAAVLAPLAGAVSAAVPPTPPPPPPPPAAAIPVVAPAIVTPAPAPVAAAPQPPLTRVLKRGARGDDVLALQQRLYDLKFDPGKLDGIFETSTQLAVWAYQAIIDAERDGTVTPELWQRIQAPLNVPAVGSFDPAVRRAEVDLPRQIVTVWAGGELQLVTKVSTGHGRPYCENGECGNGKTNPGVFKIRRRMSGWLKAPLGELYNPLYFDGGIAFHGSLSVPNFPASHGCVRLPMHVARYFPSMLNNGDPVYVTDGKIEFAPAAPATPPPPAPDPVAEVSDVDLITGTPV